MTLIRSRDADRFLSQTPEIVSLYLFHGSDSGLASERARKVVASLAPDPADPFSLARLSAAELESDNHRLVDEALTAPLFSASRCIFVDATATSNVPGVDIILRNPPESVRIVIVAGLLRKDAALLALCADDSRAAAIECNLAEGDEILTFIKDELAKNGVGISDDAKVKLASLLGSDRAGARSELDKLLSFIHGRSTIGVEDVVAVISANSGLEQEMAISAAFNGKFREISDRWEKLASPAADAQLLLSTALRHAFYLHYGQLRNSGSGSKSGTKIRRWIKLLSEAVRRSRREPSLASSIAWRCLSRISDEAKTNL